MRVKELMSSPVEHCALHSSLADAAHVMWDKDCGFVPVVDHERGTLAGVVTDRDACMAAYTKAAPLHQIPVTVAMSRAVYAVGPDDDLSHALDTMREHQVRRLPVVDRSGALVGVLALNDVVRGTRNAAAADRRFLASALLDTLVRISDHRPLVEA
jgi:CBS domain-containing protein